MSETKESNPLKKLEAPLQPSLQNLLGGQEPPCEQIEAGAPEAPASSSFIRNDASLLEHGGNASDTASEGGKQTASHAPLHHAMWDQQLPRNAASTGASMSSLTSAGQSSNNLNSLEGNISSANSVASSCADGVTSTPPAPLSTPLIPTLFGKKVDLPAAVAATASGPRGTKRPRSETLSSIDPQVSEDEGERQRRRQDRNLREQQRSHQINHQIDHLRDLLLQADLRFKPDKYSTLATVASYISELQDKRQHLEEEHSQLLQTLQETANIMTKQYMAPQTQSFALGGDGADANSKVQVMADGTNAIPAATDSKPPASQPFAASDSSSFCGIDYRAIFMAQNVSNSCFGTSITSIDGRFLDCSRGFEDVSGFTRRELLPLSDPEDGNKNDDSTAAEQYRPNIGEDGIERNLSLFNVLDRRDMERIFHTMSDMLKRPVPAAAVSNEEDGLDEDFFLHDTYTTFVTLSRHLDQQVQLSLSLVRTADRRPRLFNCTLIPQEGGPAPVPFNTAG